MTNKNKNTEVPQCVQTDVILRCESLFYKYFKKIVDKEIKEEENKTSW